MRSNHPRVPSPTEAPYVRGVGWDVFDTGCDDAPDWGHDRIEIERMDDPLAYFDEPWGEDYENVQRAMLETPLPDGLFLYDDEAELLVLFLACDGDKAALKALREIGCTDADLRPILALNP